MPLGKPLVTFVVVQLLSHVQFFTTSWTAACQASLSFTIYSDNYFAFLHLVTLEVHKILCDCFAFWQCSTEWQINLIFASKFQLIFSWNRIDWWLIEPACISMTYTVVGFGGLRDLQDDPFQSFISLMRKLSFAIECYSQDKLYKFPG